MSYDGIPKKRDFHISHLPSNSAVDLISTGQTVFFHHGVLGGNVEGVFSRDALHHAAAAEEVCLLMDRGSYVNLLDQNGHTSTSVRLAMVYQTGNLLPTQVLTLLGISFIQLSKGGSTIPMFNLLMHNISSICQLVSNR